MASAGVATGAGVAVFLLLPEPPHAFKLRIIHNVRNRTISFFMTRSPLRYLFQPVFYHLRPLFAREKSGLLEQSHKQGGKTTAGIIIRSGRVVPVGSHP